MFPKWKDFKNFYFLVTASKLSTVITGFDEKKDNRANDAELEIGKLLKTCELNEH